MPRDFLAQPRTDPPRLEATVSQHARVSITTYRVVTCCGVSLGGNGPLLLLLASELVGQRLVGDQSFGCAPFCRLFSPSSMQWHRWHRADVCALNSVDVLFAPLCIAFVNLHERRIWWLIFNYKEQLAHRRASIQSLRIVDHGCLVDRGLSAGLEASCPMNWQYWSVWRHLG